jgi:phosphatidylinositol glycan class A protein
MIACSSFCAPPCANNCRLHLNKYTKYSFAHVDHAVAVSNTCRENLVLRSCLAPELISVIPNAVDVSRFTPDPSLRRPMNKINIVIISRLTYRKGIDLIAPVIVAVAQRHPRVHFIIGGDGPKRLLLEEMRERHQLYDRVELLGAVPHDKVRDVLCRGHIFLNCSLTDSFCIAILEAAACGLTVVSTRVGGIPEVLPEDMVALAEPNVSDLTRAVLFATTRVGSLKPWANHERIRNMYDWSDVSERTEAIYDLVMEAEDRKLLDRFLDFRVVGSFGQLVSCILETLLHLLWLLLEFLQPAAGIELAPNWPAAPSSASPERGGSNLDRSR